MQIDPRCDTNQSFLSLPLFLHSAKQDHRVSATGNPIVVDEMFIILLEATTVCETGDISQAACSVHCTASVTMHDSA